MDFWRNLCLDKSDLLMVGGGETKNVKWGI